MHPSLNPALKIAAFKLSPPSVPMVFNPSTRPHASATTFLNAPQSSAPSGSEAACNKSVGVESVSASRSATDKSSDATNAVVMTPPAASGAMVGPVSTASGFEQFAFFKAS